MLSEGPHDTSIKSYQSCPVISNKVPHGSGARKHVPDYQAQGSTNRGPCLSLREAFTPTRLSKDQESEAQAGEGRRRSPVPAGMSLECRSYCLPEESKSVSPDEETRYCLLPRPGSVRTVVRAWRSSAGERRGSDPFQGLKVKEHGLLKERRAVVRQACVLGFQLLFWKKPLLNCNLFQRPRS